MIDTSNRLPDGGFLLPAIPAGYLDDPTEEAARLAPLDAQLDAVRATFDAELDTHDVRKAQGVYLDKLGAWVNVPRLAGEGDEQYRQAIPATVQHGIGAPTNAKLTLLLQARTGIPVAVADDPAQAGRIVVTFLGYPPQGTAIVDVIKKSKAAGIDVRVYARDPSAGQYSRLGAFRLGTQVLGGGQSFVTLYGGLVYGSGTALTRLGAFRLGTQRLDAAQNMNRA